MKKKRPIPEVGSIQRTARGHWLVRVAGYRYIAQTKHEAVIVRRRLYAAYFCSIFVTAEMERYNPTQPTKGE